MACVEHAVFSLTQKSIHPKHFELTYLRGQTESLEITRLNPEQTVSGVGSENKQPYKPYFIQNAV